MCRSVLVFLLASLLVPSAVAGNIDQAARAGDVPALQQQLAGGADPNQTAEDGEPLLLIAALAGHQEAVTLLLEAGADVGVRNENGMTALHAAAYAGHADIVELLIAKGAAVDLADNRFGVTALHVSSEENRPAVVALLLSRGAAVEPQEINGLTPLSRAGYRGHWGIADMLFAHGAGCQPEDMVGPDLYRDCNQRKADARKE